MARRVKQPLGMEYAYSNRAMSASGAKHNALRAETAVRAQSPATASDATSIEQRLNALEAKVAQLVSLVEASISTPTPAMQAAPADPAEAPPAAAYHPAPVWTHPHFAAPVFYMPHVGWNMAPAWQMAALSWPARQPSRSHQREAAHAASVSLRKPPSKRSAPMCAPPWDLNQLLRASAEPGPGHYSPHMPPEHNSFNVRICPDPENPGYGAYTARMLPPRRARGKVPSEAAPKV